MSESQNFNPPLNKIKLSNYYQSDKITFVNSLWTPCTCNVRKCDFVDFWTTLWVPMKAKSTSADFYCQLLSISHSHFFFIPFFKSFLPRKLGEEFLWLPTVFTSQIVLRLIKWQGMIQIKYIHKWLFPKLYSTFYWMLKFDSLGGVMSVQIKILKMKYGYRFIYLEMERKK